MSSENAIYLPTSDTKAATSIYVQEVQEQQQQQQQPKKMTSNVKETKNINDKCSKVDKEMKDSDKKDSVSSFGVRRRRDRRGSNNCDGRKWKRKREGSSTNISIGASSGCSSSSSTSPGNSSPGSWSSSSAGSCSSSDGEDEVLSSPNYDRNMYDGNFENSSSNKIGMCIDNPLHPEEVVNNDDSEVQPEEEKSLGIQQPAGWRVKLYRLNADGSWDDCGTGRITCNIGKMDNHKDTMGLQPDEAIYAELGDPTLNMLAEIGSTKSEDNAKVLLKTRVLLRGAYQRQGDNIITWCEPFFSKDNISSSILASAHKLIQGGVDLALSFQDNAGCLEIWKQITEVQGRALDIMRNRAKANYHYKSEVSYQDNNILMSSKMKKDEDRVANTIPEDENTTLDHHEHKHPDYWQISQSPKTNVTFNNGEVYPDTTLVRFDTATSSHTMLTSCVPSTSLNPLGDQLSSTTPHLPTPTLQNLEEVADLIAAAQIQQREQLAMLLSSNECAYLLSLLRLFPYAEKKDDFRSLATLAACIKSILLLNDPTIIELIVSEAQVFENVCSVLEYDPDLRIKANHRWFIRERSKFRTVLKMENEELVNGIFRSFRVCYLRDTLLRPTMDESSLSTLASLLQFTHADVVRGVTCGDISSHIHTENENIGENSILSSESSVIDPTFNTGYGDSYLIKVLRMLGVELRAIYDIERNSTSNGDAVDCKSSSIDDQSLSEAVFPTENGKDHDQMIDEKCNGERSDQKSASSCSPTDISSANNTASTELNNNNNASHWKQHLLPQDESLSSRKIRRKGCLSFLKELFHMVRTSLQQDAKDDFYNMIVLLDVPLEHTEDKDNYDSSNQHVNEHMDSNVNLLSLLGSILFDTNTEIYERTCALEILSAIVMHDSGVIRRHCLDFFAAKNNHNDNSDVLSHNNFWPGRPRPNEQNTVMFQYGPDDLLLSLLHVMVVEKDAGLLLQASEIIRIIIAGPSDQNSFLAMFYEHYIQWLLVPFQYTVLIQVCCPPFLDQQRSWNPKMQVVLPCAVRACFTVELLSFCVGAHCYRMKAFVLKNRILGIILSLLSPSDERNFFWQGNQLSQIPPTKEGVTTSGGRCFTLAALRFLRSALCIRDEFYNLHIIQNNLFKYVFEAFRANPVGDNLVASAIAEMCDFIHAENIESLMEHIVENHLSAPAVSSSNGDGTVIMPSLEEIATPYVETFTLMREKHAQNMKLSTPIVNDQHCQHRNNNSSGGNDFFDPTTSINAHQNHHNPRVGMSVKAQFEQRKFHENVEEDSYFSRS